MGTVSQLELQANSKNTSGRAFLATILFLLLISVSASFFSPSIKAIELSKSMDVSEGLAASYGYVLAQDLSISKIQTEFPSLAQRANSVRMQFQLEFLSVEDMHSALMKVMGEDRLAQFDQQMLDVNLSTERTLGSERG